MFHDVQGTIVRVDVGARWAALEYFDPGNGATREVTGEVPPKCTITIDGKVATLADLRIGDVVVVTGQVNRRKKTGKDETRIVAEEIRVIHRNGNE